MGGLVCLLCGEEFRQEPCDASLRNEVMRFRTGLTKKILDQPWWLSRARVDDEDRYQGAWNIRTRSGTAALLTTSRNWFRETYYQV